METIKTNLDNFFLWIGDQPGREKITIGMGEAGIHYTAMPKWEKKVFEIQIESCIAMPIFSTVSLETPELDFTKTSTLFLESSTNISL